jgi:hypothetical protein
MTTPSDLAVDAMACETLRAQMLAEGWTHGAARGVLLDPTGRLRALTYFAEGSYWIEVGAYVAPKVTKVARGVRLEDVL